MEMEDSKRVDVSVYITLTLLGAGVGLEAGQDVRLTEIGRIVEAREDLRSGDVEIVDATGKKIEIAGGGFQSVRTRF